MTSSVNENLPLLSEERQKCVRYHITPIGPRYGKPEVATEHELIVVQSGGTADLPQGVKRTSDVAFVAITTGTSTTSANGGCTRSPNICSRGLCLSVFTLFVCPLFGIVALVLAVKAHSRSRDQRTMTSSVQLGRYSLIMSMIGITVFIVVATIVLYVLCFVPPSPSSLTCEYGYQPNGACYKYALPLHPGRECNYGYSDGSQFCYYDAAYKSRKFDEGDTAAIRGADELCDTIGADLSDDELICYYSSTSVCQFSPNYANGICYTYRVSPTKSGCSHGHVALDGHCLYDKRYFINSKMASCDSTSDQVGDFCYSSSFEVCRYASNYADSYGCMPFAILRTSDDLCASGVRKDAYCLYNQRKTAIDMDCPKGSEFSDGYCYYVK